MSVREFGPDDTWPAHQKPYWRTALLQARSAGWTLRHLSSPHWFGVVVCPAGEHTFSVDSTARGAESIAAEVPKLLRACPHGVARAEGSKVAHRRAEAERLVGRAEELVDLAAADLSRAESRHRAWAELDRLELLLQTAHLTVEEGLLLAQEEALDRAAALEDAPDAEAVSATVDEAEGATEAAIAVAVRIRRTAIGATLLARVADVRTRIGELRARLSRLQ